MTSSGRGESAHVKGSINRNRCKSVSQALNLQIPPNTRFVTTKMFRTVALYTRDDPENFIWRRFSLGTPQYRSPKRGQDPVSFLRDGMSSGDRQAGRGAVPERRS